MSSSSLNWRIASIIFVFVLAGFVISPNFVDYPKDSFLSKSKIRYGLDIQGGTHLVMGVHVEEVLTQQMERMGESILKHMKDEGVQVKSIAPMNEDKMRLVVDVEPEQAARVREFVGKNYSTISISEIDGKLVLESLDYYTNEKKKDTINQAIETIRNRIDQFGVSEPSITAQGTDRILVQLPGIEDAERAKELINKTARLEFMMVADGNTDLVTLISEAEKKGNYSLTSESKMKYSDYVRKLNEDLQSKLPPKTRILFAKNDNVESIEQGRMPYLLRTDTNLGGEHLRDASIQMGEYNQPEVSLSFNAEGTMRFSELTGASIGKQMAIVLDDVVYSAPVIQTQIAGGTARITLGGRNYQQMMEEAKTIAMALRAGALPAKLEQLEERTVGPSLGADSIAAGIKASYIGAGLIFLFMIGYYRFFGLVASLGLFVNLLLLLAGLTMIDATLTLPGIAGIALTLGMAVDANVIINERIKDELKKGAEFKAAVREGYAKAFSAIFDSNITTIATCMVLIYFGTGPVRGFGVTLTVGLVTSMFSAIYFTRTIVDMLIYKFNVQKISI